MEYRCVDVGTEKCPCILMEAGQCYTCRMCRDGVCACGESWRGSCPYTTWLQQGGRIQDAPRVSEALILSVREYAPHLSVVTLSVPRGLAQRCRTLGTYIIVESLGWHIPLSVLRSTYAAGTASHTTPAAASTAGTAPAGSASTDIQSASIKTDTDLIPASASQKQGALAGPDSALAYPRTILWRPDRIGARRPASGGPAAGHRQGNRYCATDQHTGTILSGRNARHLFCLPGTRHSCRFSGRSHRIRFAAFDSWYSISCVCHLWRAGCPSSCGGEETKARVWVETAD